MQGGEERGREPQGRTRAGWEPGGELPPETLPTSFRARLSPEGPGATSPLPLCPSYTPGRAEVFPSQAVLTA